MHLGKKNTMTFNGIIIWLRKLFSKNQSSPVNQLKEKEKAKQLHIQDHVDSSFGSETGNNRYLFHYPPRETEYLS